MTTRRLDVMLRFHHCCLKKDFEVVGFFLNPELMNLLDIMAAEEEMSCLLFWFQ